MFIFITAMWKETNIPVFLGKIPEFEVKKVFLRDGELEPTEKLTSRRPPVKRFRKSQAKSKTLSLMDQRQDQNEPILLTPAGKGTKNKKVTIEKSKTANYGGPLADLSIKDLGTDQENREEEEVEEENDLELLDGLIDDEDFEDEEEEVSDDDGESEEADEEEDDDEDEEEEQVELKLKEEKVIEENDVEDEEERLSTIVKTDVDID
jgi:hypothetical protein